MKYRERIKLPLILVALFSISGCFMPEIPVIGVDENGNPGQTFIPEKDYKERLGAVIGTVQDSSIPALEKQEARPDWMLRTMVFGVGVNAEIGIGPWKVGAFPRFRLIFSNSTEPTVP